MLYIFSDGTPRGTIWTWVNKHNPRAPEQLIKKCPDDATTGVQLSRDSCKIWPIWPPIASPAILFEMLFKMKLVKY